MRFWDVGAHIGEHTLIAAHAVGSAGEIHAFEPSPEIFSLLSLNIRSNGLGNVRANQLAVSDSSKETIFEVFEEPSISRLKSSWSNSDDPKVKRTKVKCVSLGEYSKTTCIPNLIKIDVEGAELGVLKGMGGLLALEPHRAPVLVFEFCQTNTQRFGYRATQLITHLNDCGFTIYSLSKGGVVPVAVNTEYMQSYYPEDNLIAAKMEPCVHSD
jgi:FkbM family methyltransferase